MMSENKPKKKALRVKGSIILELLAVLLAVALIFSLVYPQRLWKAEEKNQELCRDNLWHIWFAEITYMEEKLAYNDTLQKVVDFIVSDTTSLKLHRFTNLDTILAGEIIKNFQGLTDTVSITVDSVFGEGPDSVITNIVNVEVGALVDSMLAFANDVDLDTTEAFVLDSLRSWELFAAKIDSMAFKTLDQLYACPTVGREYIVKANNDTTPKLIDIYCPIDSTDKENLKKDFKLSFLGGLKINNHGALEQGEKTW
jgi:hypothetical protein